MEPYLNDLIGMFYALNENAWRRFAFEVCRQVNKIDCYKKNRIKNCIFLTVIKFKIIFQSFYLDFSTVKLPKLSQAKLKPNLMKEKMPRIVGFPYSILFRFSPCQIRKFRTELLLTL